MKLPLLLLLCAPSGIRGCPKCPTLRLCNTSPELEALTKVRFAQTVTGDKVYGGCNLPDPQSQPKACGLPANTTTGWMCDPNGLLQPKQVAELQSVLEKVNTADSYCRCGQGCKDTYIPNPIMVAVIQHLRVPDLSNLKCKTSECFDVHPQKDPDSLDPPAESEINKGLESLKYNLPDRWKQYLCDDYVFIVYVQLNQQFHIYAGPSLPVPESFFQSAAANAGDRLLSTTEDLPATLTDLVQTVAARVNVRDNTKLIIGLTCVVVIAALMVFGVIITVVYCRKERAAGKTYSQILRREANSMMI